MQPITFSETDRQAIAYERYHPPDPRVPRPMEIRWLKQHAFHHERIATLAGCSRSTVQRTLTGALARALARHPPVPPPDGPSPPRRPPRLSGRGFPKAPAAQRYGGPPP